MEDLIDILNLSPLLEAHEIEFEDSNFEKLYSRVHGDETKGELCRALERRVRSYFSALRLPDEPTIYDHLVLSLREKDAIATFNWDPFLWQAAARNRDVARGPDIFFLHGCAILGYCPKHRTQGPLRTLCGQCGRRRRAVPLLYPVDEKDYTKDMYIAAQWKALEIFLEDAFIMTIFGYGAPATDVAAVELMQKAWGSPNKRVMEEIEIIDRPNCDEDEMAARWNGFINSHHYQVHDDFFDSTLGQSPRRSVETQTQRLYKARWYEVNRVPQERTMEQIREWYSVLVQAEITST